MKHISSPASLALFIVFAALPLPAATAHGPAELGTWWQDSRVVRALQLRESQISQINQAFSSHRSELNNLASDLMRKEAMLQSMIDTHTLDEKKAAAQIDQVVAARGRLEKERTMMALDIRRAVSYEQWKKLQEIQREQANAATDTTAGTDKPAPRGESGAAGSEEPVYQAGGPVTNPVPIQQPTPKFTPEANQKKIQGDVLLEVVIGKDGAVRSARVLRGIGYGLDQSAVDTVTKQWLFKPATLNGQPVAVQINVDVTFRFH